jgi:hypothetical protein
MNPRHRGDSSASTNVDKNLVGLQDFIVDYDRVGRLKAGMALKDRTILKSSQPFLYALVRPSGNCILACFHPFHIDAHIAGDKTIFRSSASNMRRVRAGHKRLCRYAPRIHACAAKLVAFNDGDCHARGRKPRRQGRACLARPDDDCVEVPQRGSSLPFCSRTRYSAYQSGQLLSACPIRASC